MAEYIDRQAILRSLNESLKAAKKWREEAETEEMKTRAEQAYSTFVEAMLRIKDMSAADVVEVARCKNCKHFDKDNAFCEGRGWPMQLVPEDGYCDRGEKDDRP